MSTELNMHAERAAPCPLCDSQQVQVCRDSNNPSKDSARCRECKCSAPLSVWNSRTAPSAHMGEELPELPRPVAMGWKGGSFTELSYGYTERQYRQGQRDAIAPYAARIRQLERELAERKTESIETEEALAWAAFADNGNVIIWSRHRDDVEPVAAKYGRPVTPIIAYIDGRPAGTVPEELVEIGNRMATTLEVLACALKNEGTAVGVRLTVAEWRAAAPTPMNIGKEEGK